MSHTTISNLFQQKSVGKCDVGTIFLCIININPFLKDTGLWCTYDSTITI